MQSKGLCYDCLRTGHMTRKCRNRLAGLTCCHNHSVLQDPKFTNNKKEQKCTMFRSCYRLTNCEEQRVQTLVLAMILIAENRICQFYD